MSSPAASAAKVAEHRRPLRVRPDEVPDDLTDNPVVHALVTLTPAEEELLEGLADLDRTHGNEPTPRT